MLAHLSLEEMECALRLGREAIDCVNVAFLAIDVFERLGDITEAVVNSDREINCLQRQGVVSAGLGFVFGLWVEV
jgi:hypothetical protein